MIDTTLTPKKLGRHKTRDGAYIYRIGATFPGHVNRFGRSTDIEPCQIDPNSAAPLQPGMFVAIDTANNTVRSLVAGDVAANTVVYGVVVRVYPRQQTTSNGLATGFGPVPLDGKICDVLRRGTIGTFINGANPGKGQPVYVWAAASNGNHQQGYAETVASAGNTIQLDSKTGFGGGSDTSGYGDVNFNI